MYLCWWYITQDVYTYWSCRANHTGTCVADTLHKIDKHTGAAEQTTQLFVFMIHCTICIHILELHSKPHKYLCGWNITQDVYTYWSFATNHTGICVDDSLHKVYTHIGTTQQTTQVLVMLMYYTRCIHILELHNKPHRHLCRWYITQNAYTNWSCTKKPQVLVLLIHYTYWSCTTNHTGTCDAGTLYKMHAHIWAAQQTTQDLCCW